MLFKSTRVRAMWDTWLYHHEGVHYLFFLHKSTGAVWDGISVARSEDGVHFEDCGPAVSKRADAEWLGSGSVWKADGAFVMNFSESRGGVNSIYFAKSGDLVHWERLGDELRFDADPRWYDPARSGRWDAIWALPRSQGGYLGYLTARPWPATPGIQFESFGMAESSDGLHWRALPPPRIDWGEWPRMNIFEVGAVERVGGHYFLLMGLSEDSLGNRTQWNHLGGRMGMYLFRADSPEGPFGPAYDSFRLLASRGWMTYFARFYRAGDELLVVHHSIGHLGMDDVWLAPLKRAETDGVGNLWLSYWPGNEALKGSEHAVDLSTSQRLFPDFAGAGAGWSAGRDWCELDEPHGGGLLVWERRLDVARGIFVEATLRVTTAAPRWGGAGIYIEHAQEPEHNGSVFMAETRGRTEIGLFRKYRPGFSGVYETGNTFMPDDVIERGIAPDCDVKLRLLVRGSLAELYLDDRLVQCYTMPAEASGRIGWIVESAKLRVTSMRVWSMSS